MVSAFEQYSIVWLKSAHKSFEKLSKSDQKSIMNRIDALIESHESGDIKKLKGYTHLYRLRVGDYRIIFEVNKKLKQICISAVGHRREIYGMFGH